MVGIIEEADADELQIAYVGNFQREGINYVDEANWLSNVLDNTELSLDDLAVGIGRSPAYVRSRLDILEWPDKLLKYLAENEVSFSVAREYARLGAGAELENALYFDRSTNPSARQASAYVAGILAARLKLPGAGLGDSDKPTQDIPTPLTCDACKTHPDNNQLAYGGYCFLCLAGAPRNYLDSIKTKGGD